MVPLFSFSVLNVAQFFKVKFGGFNVSSVKQKKTDSPYFWDCTTDLFLIFVWEETASGTPRSKIGNGMDIYIFFCSSLSQTQSRPIHKQEADQLCSPFSVLLFAVTEAVLSHTKLRIISSLGLSLRRELCAGWFLGLATFHQNTVLC